jgi:hypothetical protein
MPLPRCGVACKEIGMGSQTWYRGEGVNIAPAKPGGVTHDFADGLYFADTLDGAAPFARRAPDPADQRLYQVRLDFDAIKVLNLSADPRWTSYMKQPLSPAGGMSRSDFLRQMPSAEHYNAFFTDFVTANKIDLNQYDAVVGPLIQHGGNQMCVLQKNGQPSALAMRLRGEMIPVSPAVTPATPKGLLRFNGKLGPGIKTVAGSLLAIAVTLFLSWLLGKFMESAIRSEISRQLANLEPEVLAKINQNKSQVLFILAEGGKAFAELRFAVETTTTPDFNPYTAPLSGISGQTGFPTVSLNDFRITDHELPKGGVADGSEMKMAGTYARVTSEYFKTTVELTASDEEVRLFRAYLDEINWYNDQLSQAPSVEDERRLTRDRDALQARLDLALKD